MNKSIALILILLIFTGVTAAEEYTEYSYSRQQVNYFSLIFDKDNFSIITYNGDKEIKQNFDRDKIDKKKDAVYYKKAVLFDADGLKLGDKIYPYDRITDTRIISREDDTRIDFLTSTNEDNVRRFKKGNLISFNDVVTIEKGDFIRGTVVSVLTDVEVFGEVNKDVIALFGSVYVGQEAYIRGDVVSSAGKVTASKSANIYGEIYDLEQKKTKRHHRFYRGTERFSLDEIFLYNRVDGLQLGLRLNYNDPDSVMPRFWLGAGYAFESERWRYEFGLEQTLLSDPALSVGGRVYRQLLSDDDRKIGPCENTIFALLFTEDFRDYYEAEGGQFYIKSTPMEHLDLEVGYNYYETKWLKAHRHLWSLFGGSKLFSPNFGTVPEPLRSASIAEIDSTSNGAIYLSATYNTIDKEKPFDYSGWYLNSEFEYSHDNFNSDYDYKRFMAHAVRYQEINRYQMVIFNASYGSSNGYLPIYKRFYMGGVGSLLGYDNKEYIGTEYWSAQTAYRFRFRRSDLAFSVFWDVGQIANDRSLGSEIDTKHDLGAAIYFGSDFNISLAKRLDRSYDDNPVFYARFQHSF